MKFISSPQNSMTMTAICLVGRYFTDIINASQGLLIFILFIARSSTRKTIKERFVELSKRGVLAPRPTGKADNVSYDKYWMAGKTLFTSI